MIKDKKVRIAITKESHWYFFHFYFAHYVTYQTAPFQNEIFDLTENNPNDNLFIVAFRGCGKSTILTTSYPLWAILGKQQKRFVLILCQTQAQAKQHMMNMRRELESNELLKNDLGPFNEESDEWGSTSLVFSQLNARITVASTDQSIRGLRHNQHRPDLIIADDVEDLASTKTREGRNKTYQWLTGEVIPAGDRNTRLIIVGNLLHEDSLLMKIKKNIEYEKMSGIFREYPLIKEDGSILWESKYPSMNDIELERSKSANDYAWQREYMLRIVSAEDQAILSEWIHYYDELPKRVKFPTGYSSHTEIRIGVDLAISKSDSADFTAMVPALLYEYEEYTYDIYILPDIINRKLNFPETVDLCKILNETYKRDHMNPIFIIEDVAYQRSLPQQLQNDGIYDVKTTHPGHQDKRTRLVLTASMIKTGKVLFPRKGAEELIQQIIHFGVEKHDDLVDAFTGVVHSLLEDAPRVPRIYFLG